MKYNLLTTVAIIGLLVSGATTATNPPPASEKPASAFSPEQKAQVEKLIGEYLQKHPEIVMSALQAAMEQERKQAAEKMEKAVAENRDQLLNDKNSPVVGNPAGKQSLVVFLDPYCGYCKKLHGEIDSILKKDKDLKVVYKDIPILGPDSHTAVQAFYAAKEQGKYAQLQNAVMSAKKHLDLKALLKLASSVGLDSKKLEKDMKGKVVNDQIEATIQLASKIGVQATPLMVINGTKVVSGYVKADELVRMLASAGEAQKQAEK